MNRFTRRVGAASARRPWSTVVAWVVVAAAVIALAGTAGGTLLDDMVAPGSQSEHAMDLLDDRFPKAAGGSAMAVFAAGEGDRLARHRPAIEAALARIAKVEHAMPPRPFVSHGRTRRGAVSAR